MTRLYCRDCKKYTDHHVDKEEGYCTCDECGYIRDLSPFDEIDYEDFSFDDSMCEYGKAWKRGEVQFGGV